MLRPKERKERPLGLFGFGRAATFAIAASSISGVNGLRRKPDAPQLNQQVSSLDVKEPKFTDR